MHSTNAEGRKGQVPKCLLRPWDTPALCPVQQYLLSMWKSCIGQPRHLYNRIHFFLRT